MTYSLTITTLNFILFFIKLGSWTATIWGSGRPVSFNLLINWSIYLSLLFLIYLFLYLLHDLYLLGYIQIHLAFLLWRVLRKESARAPMSSWTLLIFSSWACSFPIKPWIVKKKSIFWQFLYYDHHIVGFLYQRA